ncbi:hypothetical protein FE257_003440 [Aspergillus nanangensis]|uniref:PXA domain-containing protein n=1 Tax=Aspergillus nanangensis TaxID=2582783 RepID=A0AAD4CCX1_ASPNN|nr:hypothetical protein FE257_003440 [Aspergillus nanangensis]
MSSHLYRKRTADAFLEFLTNSSSMIIVFLNELSAAFEVAGPLASPEQTIQCYLDLHPEGSLANVLAEEQQQKKLGMIADDILSNFLDSKAYDCSPVREFLREILAGVVLESTISSLSRPEFLNGWIIHLFNEGESEIMSAIDAGVEGARTQGVAGTKDETDMIQEKTISKDKATEEAMVEAKRLSALMAAQDVSDQHDHHSKPNSAGISVSTAVKDGLDFSPRAAIEDFIDQPGQPGGFELLENQANDEMHNTTYENIPSSCDASEPPQQSAAPLESISSHETSSEEVSEPPLTLYRASISVDDGSDSGGKGLIRSKPTSSYLLQIEPVSARSTGWMVFRKYTDFEILHEALETISRLNKIERFTDDHAVLPSWKGQTKQALARGLEKYLYDALRYESLSESARMKWFLEKDGGLDPEPTGPVKSGFSFPSQVAFENVGKGVLGVLTNAPKGVSDGSKAVFDGVTGVFGGGTNRKSLMSLNMTADSQNSIGSPEVRLPSPHGSKDGGDAARSAASFDSQKVITHDLQSCQPNQEYGPPSLECSSDNTNGTGHDAPKAFDSPTSITGVPITRTSSEVEGVTEKGASAENANSPLPDDNRASRNNPITQEETRIAVELIFAVINELYTLSSAWNFRRTLLNAAKSYILRPGNPNLETIRGLLQESMINANTSDESLAFYLIKLRENALPTEAELKSWPPPADDAEKEHLRETARKLLVQRGLPQALTSVMGAAASREALEKVFDCLQIERIARGFVFSVLLQALRAAIL